MLKFAKFIGANTDFSTAQAFLFPRVLNQDPEKEVFGLVISTEGEDIFVYVRQKILNLEENFSSPFERVTEKLHELGEVLKSEFDKVENLRFTLFCAKESTFYVYQFGNKYSPVPDGTGHSLRSDDLNYVEILRDSKISPVLSDSSLQEKVNSGFIRPGDRILILSAKPSRNAAHNEEGRSGENKWSPEVIEQVLTLPIDDIDDAESIFAQDELKLEHQEDFAGVKNIEPVAFILIENQVQKEDGTFEDPVVLPKPRINFKIKFPSFNIWISLHRLSRRFFALIRRTSKKLLAAIGILIFLLSVAGGGYLFWQNKTSSANMRFNNLISSVETSLTEAGNLKDSDPKQAAQKIAQAKLRLSEAQGLDSENSRISEFINKLAEKEAEVLKIYKGFSLELFMSLDLIKQTFRTEAMSFSVGRILLLDPGDKSLVAIDTQLKTSSILAGPQQLGNAKLASLNGSHVFVYSSDKGIVHIDTDTKKASIIATPDPEWGDIKDIFGFGSNIYALDTGKSKIWKYAPTENGYSGKLEYLRSDTDLGLGKKLVIDYSVWVLTSEPDILKFTAGNSDFYAMSGLNEPLTNIDGLFVPEELDSVFILDKSTNRILVTKKNGEYLAQYINPEFGKTSDFFVDEEQKLIYLLIENKIYRTPLR